MVVVLMKNWMVLNYFVCFLGMIYIREDPCRPPLVLSTLTLEKKKLKYKVFLDKKVGLVWGWIKWYFLSTDHLKCFILVDSSFGNIVSLIQTIGRAAGLHLYPKHPFQLLRSVMKHKPSELFNCLDCLIIQIFLFC